MKKYLYNKIALFVFIFFSIVPSFAYAESVFKLDYSGLVKCDGVVLKGEDGNPIEQDRQTECDFAALMSMVKSTINWLFLITIPILVLLLSCGGLLYMSGNKKNIDTAKAIFQSAAKGFIIMLVAWVSVVTVVNWFITDTDKEVIKTFININ
jgi:hypothetical protein